MHQGGPAHPFTSDILRKTPTFCELPHSAIFKTNVTSGNPLAYFPSEMSDALRTLSAGKIFRLDSRSKQPCLRQQPLSSVCLSSSSSFVSLSAGGREQHRLRCFSFSNSVCDDSWNGVAAGQAAYSREAKVSAICGAGAAGAVGIRSVLGEFQPDLPGPGADAQHRRQHHLSSPSGIVVDAAGDVYVVDTGNSRIVEVNAQGVASIVTITGLNPALSVQRESQLTDRATSMLWIRETTAWWRSRRQEWVRRSARAALR